MGDVTNIRSSDLRDSILNALDLPTRELYLPRWDQTVLVQGAAVSHPKLTHYMERREKGQPANQPISDRELTFRRNVGIAILCTLHPETGERLFNWSDADDLREKHYNTILQIAQTALTLASGDSPVEMEAIRALDYLEAYGLDNRWDPEDLELVGKLRTLVEENVTQPDEGDVSRETSDAETDEDAEYGPKGDVPA